MAWGTAQFLWPGALGKARDFGFWELIFVLWFPAVRPDTQPQQFWLSTGSKLGTLQ